MRPIKYTRDELWAKYRIENLKLQRCRTRQAKLKKLISKSWLLLKDTKADKQVKKQ